MAGFPHELFEQSFPKRISRQVLGAGYFVHNRKFSITDRRGSQAAVGKSVTPVPTSLMTADEFRSQLMTLSAEDIVDQFILTEDPGPNISEDALRSLASSIRVKFDIDETDQVSPIVVGSAKLGFALLEKPAREGRSYQPAYRPYCPGRSDIDVAVVSPALYRKIWQELAWFGSNQLYFPWRSDLSAYMLHGWIRPDKFPPVVPQRCQDWKKLIYEVSQSRHFRYKKLRCGIFLTRYFLKIYQQRGVVAAQQAEHAL